MLQKIASKDLKVGMFVTELDRPWMDTPFLLQGFMLDDDEQIAQMRAHTEWVMIDEQRSVGPDFDKKPARKATIAPRDLGKDPIVSIQKTRVPTPAGPASAAPSRPAPSRAAAKTDSAEPSPGRQRREPVAPTNPAALGQQRGNEGTAKPAFDDGSRATGGAKSSAWGGMFGQLADGIKNLFGTRDKEAYADGEHAFPSALSAAQVRASFVPESVQLVVYEDQTTVEEELTSATDSYVQSQQLLTRMIDDIRTGTGLHADQIDAVIENMVDSMMRNPDAMMWVAKLRESDSRSYDQGLGVAINLVAFGRHLGYPKDQLSHLGVLGLMLDIGKIRVRREVLEKADRLSPDEFAEVKRHVQHSNDILTETANIHPDIIEAVAQHHERMNGSGYPLGLAGNKICVFGRMAAISDTFSAVTKRRPYAAPVSAHEALQMLSNWSGTQFQTDMVEQFIQSIGVFPVGSLVELSTGEVAVVATHNKLKRLKPKVLVVTEADKTLRKYPVTRDLIYDVSDRPTYIRRGLPSNAYGIDPAEFYLA